ncbi:hypothetical protein C0583_05225 [Candidatus Parcubacteria bacterium]|nr:MAG: hypothetical protein C0583_05225 [Candidatus Parcubacteria bacterium]
MKKILEYLFYIFLFLFPLQTRLMIQEGEIDGGFFEYGTFSLYLSDVILLILLTSYFLYQFKKKSFLASNKVKKFWIAIAVLEFMSFVSIFVASDKLIAMQAYLRLVLGIGLFAFVSDFFREKAKLVFAFSFVVLSEAILSIVQFVNQSIGANKYLGIASHDPTNLGVSVVEGMGNLGFIERWLRSYGTMDHPNILGAFLALGLLVFIIYTVNRNKNLQREHDLWQFVKNIYAYIFVLFTTLGLFFTFSRAAWLGFSFGIVFYLFYLIFKNDKLSQKYFLPLFLIIGTVCFMVSIPYSNLIEARLKSQGKIEFISKTERINSIQTAKEIIDYNFILGTGIGNYTIEMKNEHIKDQPAYAYQPVNNTFLLVLSEAGIFALIAFVMMFVFLLSNTYYNSSKTIFIFKTIIYIVIMLMMLFDHWWWSLHFGIIYFWLILGIVEAVFGLENESANVV